ncbi:CPBP family intramembrane metalloprotease [Gallaecimonas kandeliae]|uniref:CPBP family intramembrane glutamic endopeptidase n=1 Tax=Gallaecimonas kandeliae TaxID=3029055 RepID=UPI002648D503|nr:CPBP family intramembrane glutamic endopeptidase [Gallaecimonas kandeliae]WKE64244.1 CPBP family intramembrane metalloprotease [Gallaecimonas kandeliae]
MTEEALYRGYAIGVGGVLLHSTHAAVVLSLISFTVAHFRWGAAHMLSVVWAGALLSALFVLTENILACMVAHLLIDAVGVLLAHALFRHNAARLLPRSE